jgi:hypothetical protein
MAGEFRTYWRSIAAKAKVPDPVADRCQARFYRVAPMFHAVTALEVATVAIRTFDPAEAGPLADAVRARSAFTRGRGDAYAWQASTFGGRTLLQGAFDPETDAASARAVADRAERLAFVATTYWLPRFRLHKLLALTSRPPGEGDLYLDPGIRHPSMRSPREARAKPIVIDDTFAKRFRRYGFPRVAGRIVRPKGFAAEKVDLAITWLREARVEVHNDAALIKTVIGLEALFVQEKGEPLAHTISERLAFLLGRDPAQRASLYRLSKRFYEARSNVVHSGSRERTPAETVELATQLLLMGAQALAENADAMSSKDASRAFFDGMRWSVSARPPPLPFPAGVVARLLRAAQRPRRFPPLGTRRIVGRIP